MKMKPSFSVIWSSRNQTCSLDETKFNPKRHSLGFPKLFAFCLLVASSATWAENGQIMSDLRRMVDTGQYEAAYNLGQEQAERQGDPHFDFLFGLAAVNSSHFPEGVLALERHLSVVPANDRARLELAKGYYELGEYPRSRQEFEFVMRYNPPKEVRANIQKYLDAMQTREMPTSKATSHSYIEFGLGHDSNVNAGTYNDQINLITGPVFLSDPDSAAADSLFMQLLGGGQWLRRIDAQLAVFAGLDFDFKRNPSASQFDTRNLGGYLGFSVLKGKGLYRLSLADGVLWVNDDKYRNTRSLTGESQYSLGRGYSFTGVAQYSELAYSNQNKVRDSNMLTLGGGLQKSFQSAWQPTLGLQLTWAQESNLHMRHDLDRDAKTVRLSFMANPTERVGVSLGLSRQESNFDFADIAFGTEREDRMWLGDFGINYLWSRNWLLRADVQHTANESNQALYSYRRVLWGLRTRYLF